jgi:hypothetical protein
MSSTITTIEIAGLTITRTDTPYSTPNEISITLQDSEWALPKIVIEREYTQRNGWRVAMSAGRTSMSPAAALAWGAVWSYACGIAADLETDVIEAPEF